MLVLINGQMWVLLLILADEYPPALAVLTVLVVISTPLLNLSINLTHPLQHLPVVSDNLFYRMIGLEHPSNWLSRLWTGWALLLLGHLLGAYPVGDVHTVEGEA